MEKKKKKRIKTINEDGEAEDVPQDKEVEED